MNLSSFDLNLLLVFDAVMAERHVTRAGDRVGLSQPAVSNALNRLRYRLDDELFLRGPDGMRPTPRAVELSGPIRAALDSLETALDPASFDPSTARRTFRIATHDYVVEVLFPTLVKFLEVRAPGIDIRLTAATGRTLELLDEQAVDFGISAFGAMPERISCEALFDDHYVCLMRDGHPLSGKSMTIKAYAEAKHLLVSLSGDATGFVDRALLERGLTRRVALTVNQFSAAPRIVAASDFVVTVPQRLAGLAVETYGLRQVDIPIKAPDAYARTMVAWHERLGRHPALVWMRQTLQEVSAAL